MKPATHSPYPILEIQETTSTNTYLRNYLGQHPDAIEGTTVRANFQTAGRGQRGNSWESETGKNLLFSTVLFPDFLEANQQFYLSQIITLAIQESLSRHTDNISIKWPNDLYWNDLKICGMLIENDISDQHIAQCIMGVGININQEHFRSPAPNPVSLKQITGTNESILSILCDTLNHLQHYYTLLQQGAYETIDRNYHAVMYRRTGIHRFRDSNGIFEASITGVSPQGLLTLQKKDGECRQYAFKEVAFIL